VTEIDVREARAQIASDWLLAATGDELHFAALSDVDAVRVVNDAGMHQETGLVCGEVTAGVYLPGWLSRMGAPRCAGCCEALGYPAGVGAPRNDDGCRERLAQIVGGS
jgi:hypothetical protein